MPAEAPPAIVPAKTGPSVEQVAARAAQSTISVSSLPTGDMPAAPPKRGSARAKLFDQMQKQFGGETSQPAAKTEAPASGKAPPPPIPPSAEPDRKPVSGESVPPETPAAAPSAATADTPPPASSTVEAGGAPAETTKDGKRVSPWKLVDQFKERAAKAEARIVELEKVLPNEAQRKAVEEELTTLRTKVKEMGDDLRFYNAEKYDPDILAAKEAYNRAFARAMTELKGVAVKDPATEQSRALTVDDVAELVFAPLQQAQAIAKEVFGDLAPYVMDHRNEIKRLWDEQQAKVDELKKTGGEREKKRMEAVQAAVQKTTQFLAENYEKANAEIVADPKHGMYFKPHEGDTEWNSRLEKGYKFVDETNALNPNDPKLTPEQRLESIRRYAATRARAAVFPAMRFQLAKVMQERDAALAELKQYKESAPPAGGRAETPKPTERPRGMAGLYSDLQKIAH